MERAEEELKHKLVQHREAKAKPVRLAEIHEHAARQVTSMRIATLQPPSSGFN